MRRRRDTPRREYRQEKNYRLGKNKRRGEDLYTVRDYIQRGQISVYLCITYGIVIIEIYSCNKEIYTYIVA